MSYSEKIRAARIKAGITQKELAKRLGVSSVVITQYEKGKRRPKIERLEEIAAALNCPLSDLTLTKPESPEERELYLSRFLSEAENFSRLFDVQKELSLSESRVISAMKKLNDDGQRVAVERVEELTEIPKYKKAASPDPEAEG